MLSSPLHAVVEAKNAVVARVRLYLALVLHVDARAGDGTALAADDLWWMVTAAGDCSCRSC